VRLIIFPGATIKQKVEALANLHPKGIRTFAMNSAGLSKTASSCKKGEILSRPFNKLYG
jgi:hypothetical protein